MMLAKSPNIKARDNQKPLRRQRNNKTKRNRKAKKARNQKTSRKEEENTQKRGGTLRGRNLEDKMGLRTSLLRINKLNIHISERLKLVTEFLCSANMWFHLKETLKSNYFHSAGQFISLVELRRFLDLDKAGPPDPFSMPHQSLHLLSSTNVPDIPNPTNSNIKKTNDLPVRFGPQFSQP